MAYNKTREIKSVWKKGHQYSWMIHGYVRIVFCTIFLRNSYPWCKKLQLLMEIFCLGRGNSKNYLRTHLDGNSGKTVWLMAFAWKKMMSLLQSLRYWMNLHKPMNHNHMRYCQDI